jgi:hypothetical protein
LPLGLFFIVVAVAGAEPARCDGRRRVLEPAPFPGAIGAIVGAGEGVGVGQVFIICLSGIDKECECAIPVVMMVPGGSWASAALTNVPREADRNRGRENALNIFTQKYFSTNQRCAREIAVARFRSQYHSSRHLFFLSLRVASVSARKSEAILKGNIRKRADAVCVLIEGKIMELSVETKVAIAVATGFVVLIVGAMARG